MGHPAVAEAAVVAAPHPRWGERPLAVVVLKPGARATAQELYQFLAPSFARWWLPDAFEFVEDIPRTSTGKFLKSVLRSRFCDRYQAHDVAAPGNGTPVSSITGYSPSIDVSPDIGRVSGRTPVR
jgi:acyl-CoA synthetase (AMP-forming)/AMP-acid ligase II